MIRQEEMKGGWASFICRVAECARMHHLRYTSWSGIFEDQRRYICTSALYVDKVAIRKEVLKIQVGAGEFSNAERERMFATGLGSAQR